MKTKAIVKKRNQYPWLGILKESCATTCQGMVILFTAESEGVVVHHPTKNPRAHLGEYDCNWDMTQFESFHGTIELSSN